MTATATAILQPLPSTCPLSLNENRLKTTPSTEHDIEENENSIRCHFDLQNVFITIVQED